MTEQDRFVYLMERVGSEVVKVGISRAPEERLRAMQTGHPDRLSIVRTWFLGFREARTVESIVHRVLADHRLAGEWFSVSAEQAEAEIETVITRTDGGRNKDAYRHLNPPKKCGVGRYVSVFDIRNGTAPLEARIKHISGPWRCSTIPSRALLKDCCLDMATVVAALGPRPRHRRVPPQRPRDRASPLQGGIEKEAQA